MTEDGKRRSAIAYEQIKAEGLLPAKRLFVYEKLHELGPATVAEMLETMPEVEARPNADNFHSRLGELVEQGVACVVRERECQITKRMVGEYAVTENLPIALKPRYTRKPSKGKEMPLALAALRRIVDLERGFIQQTRAHIEGGGTDGGDGVLWVLERVAFTDEEHAALVKLGQWLAKTPIERESDDEEEAEEDPPPAPSDAV